MLVLLNGTTAGTGYSQLNASGEVDLDPTGAFLDARRSASYRPSVSNSRSSTVQFRSSGP